MLLCTRRFNQKCWASNPFSKSNTNLHLPNLELFSYFSILPDYYLHSKTFLLFILMLFTYSLKILLHIGTILYSYVFHVTFSPSLYTRGPIHSPWLGGIKSTTLCHSRPYPDPEPYPDPTIPKKGTRNLATDCPRFFAAVFMGSKSPFPFSYQLVERTSMHCKKRLTNFPSPEGMSQTKLSLAGIN